MSTTTDTPAAGETATRFDDEFRKRVLACWRELGAAVAEYTALRGARPALADPSAESDAERRVRAKSLTKEHLADCREDVARFRKMLEAHDPDLAAEVEQTWVGVFLRDLVRLGIPWPQEEPPELLDPPRPNVAARGKALEVALELLHPATPPPSLSPDEDDDDGVMFEWRYHHIGTSVEIHVPTGSAPVNVWGRSPAADKGFYGTPEEVGAQLDAALTLLDAAV
ncbi:MAG TPA: hypothetical protein DEP66_00695 [Acidimicrobiaceae bacterium]|nr:hypothetical protein [Acidimicrobiaceae bacterium]